MKKYSVISFVNLVALVMVTGCASTGHKSTKALPNAPRGAEFIVIEDEKNPDSNRDYRMVAKMDEVEDYTLDADPMPRKSKSKSKSNLYRQSWDY